MGSPDKRGIATGTVVALILVIIVVLFVSGIFGTKILDAAETLGNSLGFTTPRAEKAQLPVSLLQQFFQLCENEPGKDCVCAQTFDARSLLDAAREGDNLTFTQQGANMEISLAGATALVPGAVPCLYAGNAAFAQRDRYSAEKQETPGPSVQGTFSFTYDSEKRNFNYIRGWIGGPVTANLPLGSIRLAKFGSNYLCVLSEEAASNVARTCAEMNQCTNGKVCTQGQSCSTGKIDQYYQGQGICCSGACVTKLAPEVEAQLKQKLDEVHAASQKIDLRLVGEQLAALKSIYAQYPSSESAPAAMLEAAEINDAVHKRAETLALLSAMLAQYPSSPLIADADQLSDRLLSCTDNGFVPGSTNSADEQAKCNSARDSLLSACFFVDKTWPAKNECVSCKSINYQCDGIKDKETCDRSPCAPKSKCAWKLTDERSAWRQAPWMWGDGTCTMIT